MGSEWIWNETTSMYDLKQSHSPRTIVKHAALPKGCEWIWNETTSKYDLKAHKSEARKHRSRSASRSSNRQGAQGLENMTTDDDADLTTWNVSFEACFDVPIPD